jgi:hypothetical protein
MTAVVLTVAAGVGAIAGAGRGSVSPGRPVSPPVAPGGTVSHPSVGGCAWADQTGGSVVTRSPGFPANHTAFSFPARIGLRARSARQALRLLCSLPSPPAGLMSCPAESAVDYLFRFSFPSRPPVDVRLDPTGCETVTGLGPVRWIAGVPAFWRAIGRTFGLPAAGQATFAGSTSS